MKKLFFERRLKDKNILFEDIDQNKIIYEKNLIDCFNIVKNLIKKKNIIFVVCENNSDCFLGYLSFLKNKTVPFLLSSQLKRDVFTKYLRIYKPNYIFLPKSFFLKFNYYLPIKTIGNYQILKRKKLYNYKVHKNLAIMLATSGSTGNSKIAKISYQNVNENTIQISKYLSLNKKTKTVTTLPINYTYGMSILNTFFNSKSKIYITKNNILHKDFWNIVVNKKINMISGVPYIYEIFKRLNIHKKNLPYLKVFTQAGGKLSPEVLKYFQKYVKKNKNKFFVMYGATEATSRMSFLNQYLFNKNGSIGKPIEGGNFKIIDPNNKLIKASNEEGELIYSGENVFSGYANSYKDLASLEKIKDLKTGDIAKGDNQGFYFITGRKKRMAKLFGINYNLDDIQKLLFKKGYKNFTEEKNNYLLINLEKITLESKVKKILFEEYGINKKYVNILPFENKEKNYDKDKVI